MKQEFLRNWAVLGMIWGMLSGAVSVPLIGQQVSGSTNSESAVMPRIVAPIDDNQLVELPGNLHPVTKTAIDLGTADEGLPLRRMILVLKRSDAQQRALDTFLDQQQNAKSPYYHHWLTPAEFGAKFGVAPQDVAKIGNWLRSYGFSLEPVTQGRNVLLFTGTNAQLRAAFHTEMHSYKSKVDASVHYANATNPKIPASLAAVVAGIAGLNDFTSQPLHTNLGVVSRSDSNGKWKLATLQPNVNGPSKVKPLFSVNEGGDEVFAVTPYDFATIYNAKPLWDAGIDGTGQTIAIIGRSDVAQKDIDAFRSYFGLPATKLNVIHAGDDPGLVPGDEGESDIDIEWSGAVAKNATIDFVVAANTNTSDGLRLAAQYAVDNNVAPIISVSYGECELGLGSSGNQFMEEIWRQAAAQGITVVVSAGDGGSATCDQGAIGSLFGTNVNGLASTPYNVAVGGTDLYGTYLDATAYWNTTNDPTTKQSAKSYMPELPWNNSCGNPQLLASLQASGIHDTTLEALCNDPNQESTVTTIAGGGGPSSCRDSTDNADPRTCSNPYPKPTWQPSVSGVSTDMVRDLPDVSFFAGNGLWGSVNIFCESDVTPDNACTFSSSNDVRFMSAGGTSFGAPEFAGVMALVNQKTGSAQGVANYDIYKLAAIQYNGSLACDSLSAGGASDCIFYDIAKGSNAVPCFKYVPGCTLDDPVNDILGVLPGWDASIGYDKASGLGTLNVANLVNAWNTAASTFAATTTTLTLDSPTYPFGALITGSMRVAGVNENTGTPTGDTVVTNASGMIAPSLGTLGLTSGVAAISTFTMPIGHYTFFGHYTGDATFAASNSIAGVNLAVTQAATTVTATSSQPTLLFGQSATLTATIETASLSSSPTGVVVFTNTANERILGVGYLAAGIDQAGHATAHASLTLDGRGLIQGDNIIHVFYSGNDNYTESNVASVNLAYTGPFSIAINPSPITINADSSAKATVTLTTNGGSLPAAFVLTCPAPVPDGLSCSFSPSSFAAGATTGTSILTLAAVSPLVKHGQQSAENWHGLQLALGSATVFASMMLVLPLRRRRIQFLSGALLVSVAGLLSGCGESGVPVPTAVTLTASPITGTTGDMFTFKVSIAPARGSSNPTGTVKFFDNSTVLATANVSGSSATFSTTSLTLGKHAISASYSGDAHNEESTSSPTTVDVQGILAINVSAADSLGNTTTIVVPVTLLRF